MRQSTFFRVHNIVTHPIRAYFNILTGYSFFPLAFGVNWHLREFFWHAPQRISVNLQCNLRFGVSKLKPRHLPHPLGWQVRVRSRVKVRNRVRVSIRVVLMLRSGLMFGSVFSVMFFFLVRVTIRFRVSVSFLVKWGLQQYQCSAGAFKVISMHLTDLAAEICIKLSHSSLGSVFTFSQDSWICALLLYL